MALVSDSSPSMDLLREIVLDSNRDLPLHAQLRTALERLISEHFEDENRFFSESQLIRALGVSQGTVRRALADLAQRGRLEKRQARCTIVRKNSNSIGMHNLAVFLPDYSSYNGAKYLNLLHEECLKRNMQMQPIYTHRGEQLLKAYDNLRFSPNEGGVVLLENSTRSTLELTSALGDKGYECIVIGTLPLGSGSKSAGASNKAMIEIGLQHLVDLGHRRISLLVTEPEEKDSVKERIAAFKNWTSHRTEPMQAKVVSLGMTLWDDPCTCAQRAIEEVMNSPEHPTAVFTISDAGALGAIQWLTKNGFKVPEDISVMGIDGIDMGWMVHPTLTTIGNPFEEITAATFHLLMEKDVKQRNLLIKPKLLARESTAHPPGWVSGKS